MSKPKGTGSLAWLRARNVAAVAGALRGAGELWQAEIVRKTGLSPGSVSSIVHHLDALGQVELRQQARRTMVKLKAQPGRVAGFDIGRSHLRVLLGGLDGTVETEVERRLEPGTGIAQAIEVAISALGEAAGQQRSDLLGAVVGVAGPVSRATGEVVLPSLLPEWFGADIAAEFSQALGVPVVAENDANLGALAEAAKLGQQADLIFVKLGTGIGSGLVLDGHLRRGATNTAGEVGHLPIDPNGQLCRCGNKGCLETVASVPALLARARTHMPPIDSIDALVDQALAGDVSCARMLGDAGAAVGLALALMCNVLNPGLVAVVGPIVRAGDLLMRPLEDALRRQAVPGSGSSVQVAPATLGQSATALGALWLAGDLFGPGLAGAI